VALADTPLAFKLQRPLPDDVLLFFRGYIGSSRNLSLRSPI